MTSKIAGVLELLSDGKWHELDEIRQKTAIGSDQVKRVTEFLQKYSFVTVDEAKRKIRLNRSVQEFLAQTATA